MTNEELLDELMIVLVDTQSEANKAIIQAAMDRLAKYDAYTIELLKICKEFSDQLAADLENL